MATINVSPGGWSAAYSSAATGDTLVLQPGTHVTGGRLTIGKSLIIQAADWNASTSPGKYVSSATGHALTEYAVKWEGGWATSTGANGTVFRGIGFDGRMTGGAGMFDVNADDITFEDCFFTDGRRYIGVHVGSSRVCYRTTFRRCRFRQIGARAGHDHPIYWKTARDGVVEDSLAYDNAGWFIHAYTDCDNLTVRRTVVDRSNGAATFSGDSANTVLGGYQYSTNNAIEDSILTNAQGGLVGNDDTQTPQYLVEYWYGGTAGTNYVRRCVAWNASVPAGSGVLGTIESGAPIQQTAIVNANPLYADPTNGDFRLPSNSPALGKGPTYIQPATGATRPNAVTNLAQVATSGVVNLTWTQSTSTITGNMIRYSTTTFPSSETAGTQLIDGGPITAHEISGLTNGVTYYFAVFAVNTGNPAGSQYSLPAQIASTPSAGTPPPPPPPPDDPFPGETIFGKDTVGGTWRGLSADYKRASRFTVSALQQVTKLAVRMRGTSGGTGTQSCRAIIYNDGTGALLGVSADVDVSNAMAEAWVTFTPTLPIAMPSAGGTVRLGLHTGAGTGELTMATEVVPGALVHGADTYTDGTEATWTSPGTDQYEISIVAAIEPVAASEVIAGTTGIAFFASADAYEIPPVTNEIPASDVEYRDVGDVRTYNVPRPFQVSTNAELIHDPTTDKFYIKET